MGKSPTAYSNIFWHFTGSPTIKDNANVYKPTDLIKGKRTPKSEVNSIKKLKKILKSKTLLATSREKIIANIVTEKFCCVCDLPFKDLLTHSKYYGKVAIAFSSNSIYRDFNPVLYLNDTKLKIDEKRNFDAKGSAKNFIEKLFGSHLPKIQGSMGQFKDYIKITSFDEDVTQTFYREREWRCLYDYKFMPKDVCALIVPKKYIFEIQNFLKKHKYKNISIISWEVVEKA